MLLVYVHASRRNYSLVLCTPCRCSCLLLLRVFLQNLRCIHERPSLSCLSLCTPENQHTIFSKALAEKSTREIPLVSSVMVELSATGVCSSKGQPLNQSSREPPCPSTHRQAVPIDDPIQCLLPKRCCQKCGRSQLQKSSAALCVCKSSSTRLLAVNTERNG